MPLDDADAHVAAQNIRAAAAPGIAEASIADALAALKVDAGSGLAQPEVETRLRAYGYNEVRAEESHPVAQFLAKFWGISAWMLELIMVLSAVLRKYADFVVVGVLLVVNAVLSFAQERRAAGVVAALRQRLRVNARVLRDASWRLVPARELVPGDIVRVRAGDVVPADVKVVSGEVSVDQSALTGESAEIGKSESQVLPSGCVVRRGEASGVVILTGARTYYGRTTELVQEARPALHIEKVVAKVVRALAAIVAALLIGVFTLALAREAPLAETVPLLLVLMMSAVPVALPVMFTVSMAVGARELAKRGVLVTRLSAAEDAATMDVLCVDKTGTITENRLAVTEVIPLGSATEAEVLSAGALASQDANQDPIDLAFLAAASERHLSDGSPRIEKISFTPFDARNRRTESVIERDGQRIRLLKGAMRTIGSLCGMSAADIDALEMRTRASASKGYRILAVARGVRDDVPEMIGLVALYDPPRPDARRLIAELRELGIAVKMLTGDAIAVAGEIAHQVGLANVRRVTELKGAGEGAGKDALDLLARSDGIAEVYPEDKYFVVRQLQAAGHVTGMTGDGVNDAPALRQAEVGIAVSGATDVAKGAASVVLTDPGLTNIVALVEQGRTIYQRVLTWIINKISRTILKAAFVAIAFVATGKFVVSAFTMLLLVFMTDFAKIALATDRVRASRRPETWRIGDFILVAAALGAVMVVESLLLLYLAWSAFGLGHSDPALHTFSFLTLLYFAVFSIVSVRERRWFWSSMPSATLVLALAADVVIGTGLTYAGLPGLAALPVWQTLAVFAYAMAACLTINDAVKVWLIEWRIPPATTEPAPLRAAG